MTEHPRTARSTSRPRWIATTLLAVGAGALATLAPHDAATLAPSGQVPGLLEWIATTVARNTRNVPVGPWLHTLNVAGLAAAVAAFVPLARLVSGAWLAAAAAIALGLSAPFAFVLAPPDTLVIASVALSIAAMIRDGLSWRTGVLAVLASASAPALAPAYALAWLLLERGSRSHSTRFGALGLLVAASCLPLMLSPLPDALAVDRWWLPGDYVTGVVQRAWSTALAPAGPYALALAVLGAFTARDLLPRGTRLAVAALVAASVAATGFPSVHPVRALAPLIVLLWMLVAAGLAAVVRECRPNVGGYVAAALLIGLLPGLQALRTKMPPAAVQMPQGHETLTPAMFGRIVGALPDGAVFVREDASTDMLWRALGESWRRSGKRLRVAGVTSAALPAAASENPPPLVFALPSAQLVLQTEGFMLVEAQPPQVRGVAEVRWMGTPCAVLSQGWQDVTALAHTRTVAMVADNDRSRGAVEIRAAAAEPFEPRQLNWTAYAASGFSMDTFDRANAEQWDGLLAGLDDAHVPHDPRLLSAHHNVALTIWRRPDAPRTLAIDIGSQASFVLARYAPGETQRLRLCPAFPFTPVPIGH